MLYGWPAKAGTYAVVINGSGTSGATSTMTFKLVVKAAPDSGPTGLVALARGGKCLLDPGGRTANGTKAEISNCVAGRRPRSGPSPPTPPSASTAAAWTSAGPAVTRAG